MVGFLVDCGGRGNFLSSPDSMVAEGNGNGKRVNEQKMIAFLTHTPPPARFLQAESSMPHRVTSRVPVWCRLVQGIPAADGAACSREPVNAAIRENGES
jgi:hypothetical protein